MEYLQLAPSIIEYALFALSIVVFGLAIYSGHKKKFNLYGAFLIVGMAILIFSLNIPVSKDDLTLEPDLTITDGLVAEIETQYNGTAISLTGIEDRLTADYVNCFGYSAVLETKYFDDFSNTYKSSYQNYAEVKIKIDDKEIKMSFEEFERRVFETQPEYAEIKLSSGATAQIELINNKGTWDIFNVACHAKEKFCTIERKLNPISTQ